MPQYTFRCEVCGTVFERRLSFSQSLDEVVCPQGHTQVVRVYRPPAIVFKGSGFYITDHGRNGRNNTQGKQGKRSEHATKTTKSSSEAAPAAAQTP